MEVDARVIQETAAGIDIGLYSAASQCAPPAAVGEKRNMFSFTEQPESGTYTGLHHDGWNVFSVVAMLVLIHANMPILLSLYNSAFLL